VQTPDCDSYARASVLRDFLLASNSCFSLSMTGSSVVRSPLKENAVGQ